MAITQRLLENETYPETRECLDVRWGGFCARLGLLSLVLPHQADPVAYFDAFAPRGVILTGGNDVASVASAASSALSKTRDAFELRVLELAVARQIPVLAVCRGMQLVADHHGAKLEKVAGHTAGASHPLFVDQNTRFGALLGALPAVRSYHDWAVTSVPEGFVAVARAGDGVLEAMEHRSLPIFAQMWHPEREDALSNGETAVIRALFGIREREARDESTEDKR